MDEDNKSQENVAEMEALQQHEQEQEQTNPTSEHGGDAGRHPPQSATTTDIDVSEVDAMRQAQDNDVNVVAEPVTPSAGWEIVSDPACSLPETPVHVDSTTGSTTDMYGVQGLMEELVEAASEGSTEPIPPEASALTSELGPNMLDSSESVAQPDVTSVIDADSPLTQDQEQTTPAVEVAIVEAAAVGPANVAQPEQDPELATEADLDWADELDDLTAELAGGIDCIDASPWAAYYSGADLCYLSDPTVSDPLPQEPYADVDPDFRQVLADLQASAASIRAGGGGGSGGPPSPSSSVQVDPAVARAAEVLALYGTLPLMGIKFGYVMEFIEMIGGREGLAGKTTAEVRDIMASIICGNSVVTASDSPQSTNTEAITEQLCKHMERGDAVTPQASWYVIHSHGANFLETIEAVEQFLLREQAYTHNPDLFVNPAPRAVNVNIDAIKDVGIWIDLFCAPQPLGAKPVAANSSSAAPSSNSDDVMPIEWYQYTVVNTLQSVGNVLLVTQPFDAPPTLSRAWCTYELFACADSHTATHHEHAQSVQRSSGSGSSARRPSITQHTRRHSNNQYTNKHRFEVAMTAAEYARFVGVITTEGCASYLKMLSTISTEKTECTKDADKQQLHTAMLLSMHTRTRPLAPTTDKHSKTKTDQTSQQRQDDADNEFAELDKILRNMLEQWLLAVINTYMNPPTVPKSQQELMSMNNLQQLNDLFKQSFWQFALADLYKQGGKHAVALPVATQALENRVCAVGYEHADTHAMLIYVGELHEYLQNFSAAEAHYIQCLQMHEKVFGIDHLSCLVVVNKLVELYKRLNNLPQAIRLCGRCVSTCETLYGPDHAYTLTAVHDLANLYSKSAMFSEAEPLLVRCLRYNDKVKGPQHPDTLIAVSNLASIYR
jgi:tetratricopeptide (TPR) repeat protein